MRRVTKERLLQRNIRYYMIYLILFFLLFLGLGG